jgi:phosphatidylglycerophosphate synthase/putative flippase GtrA
VIGAGEWLLGPVAARLWGAIAPAVALVVITAVSLLVYAIRNRVRGQFHDEEMDGRGKGGLTTASARHFAAWLLRPLWRGLVAVGVPPNAITTLSLGLALGAGVSLAAGRFSLGGWLYVAAGALDMLDGRVARETGSATAGGAALDSVLDRYCESAVLVGLAWYYRSTWVLAACLLALTGSLLVPYVRARGEALGAQLKDVGLFQRAERILLLGLALALSPVPEALLSPDDPAPMHWLAVAGVSIVAIFAHATAVHRLVHLVRALGGRAAERVRDPGLQKLLNRSTGSPLPRALITSAIATAIDCTAVYILVEELGMTPAWATGVGCLIGGVTAFTLSRAWVFLSNGGRPAEQALRFVFVSGTSAGLNTGGIALVLLLPGMDYRLAWVITRAVVFLTWNYPLLRDFVFQPHVQSPAGSPALTEGGARGASRA